MTICKINYNIRCHVPFLCILVLKINSLPKSGHHASDLSVADLSVADLSVAYLARG